MGAVSPVPFADEAFMKKVEQRIVIPTIEGLKKEGILYKGFIFVGLMNVDGEPMVIEYNCRMGDPETEVVIPRMENDLVEVFKAVAEGKLDTIELKIKSETATTVMLVAGGYPEAYEKGKLMRGIEEVEDALVFHAGTKQNEGGVVTNGGRVMAITAFGNTIEEAVAKSLKGSQVVDYEGKYFRSDIGKDLMNW
jgi:phosphoribosylamine--glycine ligase